MKKILYISDSFLNNSGCAIIAQHTYEIFKSRGFQPEVFTSKGYFGLKNYKYEKYFPEIYDTTEKYLKNIFNYYYNFDSAKKLNAYLKEFKPDIVHVHNLRSSSTTFSILPVLKNHNIPIVMTLHDVSLLCPIMSLTKGDGTFCNKMLCKNINTFHCITNKCAPNGIEQGFRRALFSFISNLSRNIRYVDKFVTPSDALKTLILDANIGIKNDDVYTVPNFLKNQEKNIKPKYSNDNYFLFVGRLSPEKGVNYLLEAMKILPTNVMLKIIGTGVSENNLKQYAKENNLNNVEFLGVKNREDIKAYYQNCIATILPCNWFEIFGMTNIESFINGKPVIASNIGGIPEIVEHNVNGLLFEPANVEQLKECILTYLNNPELVVEHGKNGYKKAITQYSEANYYKQLQKVYEVVINKNDF